MSDRKQNVVRAASAVARTVMISVSTILMIAGAIGIVGGVMNAVAAEQERSGNISQSAVTRQVGVDSTGQRNASLNVLAGVLYCKVFRGRSFSRNAIRLRYA